MKDTLRNKIRNGLYEKEFEDYLIMGYSFNKISSLLNSSVYALELCKWHLYIKYKVYEKKDLIKKLKKRK